MKNRYKHSCLRLVGLSLSLLFCSLITSCADDDGGGEENLGLPQVYINTPDATPITSKTDWVKGGTLRILDSRGKEVLYIASDFRGRGNTTWYNMPKKPYAIKLASRAKVLGMPAHKRWVLLANWMDRTLMRNAVSFEVARRCMSYTPRGKFVELYVNDVHAGNYYLCEHIKIDRYRVDIDEIEEDTPLQDITGGYILEFDKFAYSEPNCFYTSINNYAVAIKEPDEDIIIDSQHPAFSYIKGYIDNLEALFESGDYAAVCELIDIESFIDSWLVYNLTGNQEPAHPKSFFMHKKRNGKLYAGPVWDFDWGTFVPGLKGTILQNAFYYRYLFANAEFKQEVKKRWEKLKPAFEEVPDFIDETASYIAESNAINSVMWPISLTVNGDEKMTFDEAVARMYAAYMERIDELDRVITSSF